MAKFRYVNTAIWNDEWFVDLDSIEQHLFLYLITNSETNITGVYQLPLRRMQFETGMDQEKLKKIFERFEKDGKVYYEVGWVVMKNWLKHQSLNTNQMTGALNYFDSLPEWLKDQINDKKSNLYIPYREWWKGSKAFQSIGRNSNSNLNLNLNLNPNSNAADAAFGEGIKKL